MEINIDEVMTKEKMDALLDKIVLGLGQENIVGTVQVLGYAIGKAWVAGFEEEIGESHFCLRSSATSSSFLFYAPAVRGFAALIGSNRSELREIFVAVSARRLPRRCGVAGCQL
jgi:hypothetical protein